jgi:hypothetical protein
MTGLIICLAVISVTITVEGSPSNKSDNIAGHEAHQYLQVLRKQIIGIINRGDVKKCHYFPQHAHDDYEGHKWDKLLKLPANTHSFPSTYIYSPCMSSFNLGNSLGNYFNEIACASLANIDFIVGTKMWDYPQMPFEYKGKSSSHAIELPSHNMAFFDSLPVTMVFSNRIYSAPGNESIQTHQPVRSRILTMDSIHRHEQKPQHSPHTHQTQAQRDGNTRIRTVQGLHAAAKNRVPIPNAHSGIAAHNAAPDKPFSQHCFCEKYCWSERRAPWITNYALIRDLMNSALDAHIAAAKAKEPSNATMGTVLRLDGRLPDMSSAPAGTFLPIVPDAAIQYRCGDTVPSKVYGFLPFPAVAQLIPADAKHIYVLTDPPARVEMSPGKHTFSVNCRPIMTAMFDYLKNAFPAAVVVVKSGGDPFLDYVRLARARVAVCAASTFCLWPAIASRGAAYFPVTGLIAGWSSEKNEKNDSPYLGPNFRWLHSPRIVTQFTESTPLREVIGVLNGTIPRAV